MLLRDLEPHEILREEVARFGYIGDCANRRIEVGRILREVAAPIRARFLDDTHQLAEAARTPRQPDDFAEMQWGREALEDSLAGLVAVHQRERAEFKQLVDFETAKLQVNDAARMRRIFRDVANGLGHIGIEQGESMRSARSEVMDLVSESAGERSGLGWLLLGWLCLWNSAFCADAVSHFSQGILVVGESRSYLAHLLHRFLGMALESSSRHLEALESAKTAIGIRPSAELMLETSRYAIQCGRGAEAKQYFETAVRQEPMFLFVGLSDPDMAPLELFMVNEHASAGTAMRQSALRAIDEWQGMLDRVHASERILGETMELPFEVGEGLDEMRAFALKSEMLDAIGARSAARRNAFDLYQFAFRRLTSAVGNRDAEAAAARSHVTETVAKKEYVTRNAEAQAEAIITHTEAQLRHMVGGGTAGMTLGKGISGSLIMLIVFAAIAGVMGHNVDTSLDSPFGMVGLCLISAPVLLGISASSASGLRQVTMASEIERRTTYAREKAKATLIEVEASFTRQAEAGKRAASTLEERARAAAEALKALRATPPPALPNQDHRPVSRLAA